MKPVTVWAIDYRVVRSPGPRGSFSHMPQDPARLEELHAREYILVSTGWKSHPRLEKEGPSWSID